MAEAGLSFETIPQNAQARAPAPETSETMRAAVLTGPGRVEIRTVPAPQPSPFQVRFRVEGCGVCASNLTPWSGPEWMKFPTEPGDLGHEAWGVVDEVGDNVANFRPGQRIAALSYRGYAEFDVAQADACIALPAALDGEPFPGEPLACAMNIFRRSEIAAGQTRRDRRRGLSGRAAHAACGAGGRARHRHLAPALRARHGRGAWARQETIAAATTRVHRARCSD